jgi:signal transduction histidine kinase
MPDTKELLENELNKGSPDWRRMENLIREKLDSDPNQIRFSVDAGHIRRLGYELVGKQETALSELVKNSYDADATKVIVNFFNHDRIRGKLIVEDDGMGMNERSIREGWMRISTSEKINNPISEKFRRIRAGRKGIGRFAVQRLGEKLILETEVMGSTTGCRVIFNWEKDYIPGNSINDVYNAFEYYDKPIERHLTRLSITELKEKWLETDIDRVWNSIILLQPPFPISNENSLKQNVDRGFEVQINGVSSSNSRKKKSIETEFLSHALATIQGYIYKDGSAKVIIESQKLGISESTSLENKYLTTGQLAFSTSYFIYRSDLLSGISVPTASQLGREFGGIRVYRNGFRVLPYGEQRNDWLGLDAQEQKRTVLAPLGNTNYFGHVDLNTEENPLFEETAGREGLIENEPFYELREFIRSSLLWAITRIASVREKKTTSGQRNYQAKSQLRTPSKAIEDLIKELSSSRKTPWDETTIDESVKNRINEIKEEIELWEEITDKEKKDYLQYTEMLRVLASLGISISVFSHEVSGATVSFGAQFSLLKRIIESLKDSEVKIKLANLNDGLSSASSRVFNLAKYISSLMSTTGSRELRTLSLNGAIEKFIEQYSQYMNRQDINFEFVAGPSNLRTIEMHSSEIDSVLINFLTNSVKALRKAAPLEKKIKIEALEQGEHALVRFEDNGIGIPEENRLRVFDAFFTTTIGSVEDEATGLGTGLGLKIVSDIASSYGGWAKVVEPRAGYSCCIEFAVLSATGRRFSNV